MTDDHPPLEGTSGQGDPVGTWWKTYGSSLKNALRWIAAWRNEARGDEPREITYQEFAFRCAGDLVFDGEAYMLAEGLSEVIAEMGMPGLLRTTSATETEKSLGAVPRLHYELACHIAQTNRCAGRQLARALTPFASELAAPVKRSRGRSSEDNQLFRSLAWWAVDRGVRLGLSQGKNRGDAARNPRERIQSATELAQDCFSQANWKHVTYNMVNDAWQAHRHEGDDGRKLTVRSHAKAYKMRFEEIDRFLNELSEMKEMRNTVLQRLKASPR